MAADLARHSEMFSASKTSDTGMRCRSVGTRREPLRSRKADPAIYSSSVLN